MNVHRPARADRAAVATGGTPVAARRAWLVGAGLGLLGLRPAAAQSAAVPLVVPYAAGGLADGLGRLFAARLKDVWNAPVVVDNRPGAGGAIGAAQVAKVGPQGRTLLLGSVGMATNPHMLRTLPYRPEDLVPCVGIASAPNVLYVHPSVPATSVKELVAYATRNPGAVKFASSGVGSSPHLAAALFASQAGIEVVHVPYKGTGAAMTDFLGGQVNAYFDTMQAMPHAREGRLRVLAVATPRRIAQAPELPTVEESGVAGVVSSSWFGFFVPAAIPAEQQSQLMAQLLSVATNEGVRQQMAALGVIPEAMDQASFAAFVRKESAKWGALIRRLHIVVD